MANLIISFYNKNDMSIIKFIEKYRKSNRTLYTTPSHGQGDFAAPQALKMLGKKFFQCDYSEIEGFDNLANPIGTILSLAMMFRYSFNMNKEAEDVGRESVREPMDEPYEYY